MFSVEKFGERLSEAMAYENEMTTKQLAEIVNVNVQTVNSWKRGDSSLLLSNVIAIANALNCTIDYLVGRDDSFLDFTPKKCPPFYERLREIMKEKNISWYKLTKETAIKDSYLYSWKYGSDTKVPALFTLADYFDCTIDYLVGRDR